MVLTSLRKFALLMILSAFFVMEAAAQAQVGTIQFVAGDVKIRNAVGVERPAVRGGALAEGDTIISGSGASAQLKMVDDAIIAVRADSQIKLDEYSFKGKADGSERAFISLVKGGFRTITGLIGRTNRQNYRVSTVTATIGIRGTDFEPFLVTQEIRPGEAVGAAPSAPTRLAQAAIPVELTVDVLDGPMLLAQGKPAPGPAIPINATVAKVNSGSIGMRVPSIPAALLVVGPNQAGMATPDGKLSIIPIPTEIFRAAPPPGKPVAKPAPADKPAVAEKPGAKPAPGDKPAVAEKTVPTLPDKVAATPAPGVAAEPSPVSDGAGGAAGAGAADVRATAVVDTAPPPAAPPPPAVTVAQTQTSTTTTVVPTADREVTATTGSVSGNVTLDMTEQTATVGQFSYDVQTGTTTDTATGNTFTQTSVVSGGQLVIGDFGLLAQTQSTNAQSSLSNATSAAGAIPSLQTTATGNNTTLQAVAPVSTTQATSLINTVVSVQQSSPTLVDAAKLTTAQSQLSTATTENAKIATAQSTASAALTDLNNQLSIAQTALGSGATTLDTNPTQAGSSFASACGSAKACADLAAQYASVATTEQAAQNFTTAQNAFNNASTAAERAAKFEQMAKLALTTAQADEATIASQKTIATNANTAAGTAVTASLAAAQQAVGDFGVLAQFSADSALAAKTSIGAISTALAGAATSPAQTIFNSVSTANTAAQADATTIANIAAIDTTTASSNLASVTTKATTAQSQVDAALSVNTANSNVAGGVGGTDFRDSQAAPAVTAMNTANTAVQGAKTTATTANTDVTTKSGLLTTAKSSAVTQSGTATTAFNNAQTTFNALTAAAPVDSGTTNANQSVSNLLSLANTAAAAAQAAADSAKKFQAAQDFTNAQAQFTLAKAEQTKADSYLALATQIQSLGGVSSAQAALAQLVTDANAAKSAGDAAVASTTSALSTANTESATVAQKAIIAQYNNPTIVSSSRFSDLMVGNRPNATSGHEMVQGYSVARPNTNYVLDGTKNLVEGRIIDSFSSATFDTYSVNLSNANVKISGGTAADTFVAFDGTSANAPNYVALGRWTGTTASPLMVTAGTNVLDLGARSLHWMVSYNPPSGFVQSRSGTTAYTQLAATKPTDAAGNVGTLNSASLSANFDTQKVTAGVDVSVASKNVAGTGTSLPISGFGFSGLFGPSGSGTITTGYKGFFTGGFAGEKATGVGFGYYLYPEITSGPFTDVIQGVVAFSTTTPPAAIPQPDQNFATAYVYGTASTSARTFEASGTTYLRDGNNDVTMVAADPGKTDEVNSETISGGTAQTKGTVTAGTTTIDFGRWQGPGVSVASVDNGVSANRTVMGSYHWIKGPPVTPFYLTSALTTTSASYTTSSTGGSVTDQTGAAGTLDAASVLTVNFLQQSVTADIRATTTGGTWRGFGSGIRLETLGQFFAGTGGSSPHNNLEVFYNSSTANTFGVIDGIFMGNAANAAGVGFSFGHSSSGNFATGVAAFTTATAHSTTTSYTAGLFAAGKITSPVTVVQGAPNATGYDPQTVTPALSGANTIAALDPEFVNAVIPAISATSSARTQRDTAGMVFKADAEAPVVTPVGCTTSCGGVSRISAALGAQPTNFGNPDANPPATSAALGADTLANSGKDTATGIQWGRYIGFITYADRITGTTNTTGNNAVTGSQFDARTSNWHGIWAPAMTSPPVLPTSGTVSYTHVGGTLPSDSTGAVATSAATATLTADFTNMKVNTTVNATIGATNWAASASNVPIGSGAYFQAEKSATKNTLTVTATGATTTAGKITGIFSGNAATGTNGGAMLGYALNKDGASGVTMQGVAAFKKP